MSPAASLHAPAFNRLASSSHRPAPPHPRLHSRDLAPSRRCAAPRKIHTRALSNEPLRSASLPSHCCYCHYSRRKSMSRARALARDASKPIYSPRQSLPQNKPTPRPGGSARPCVPWLHAYTSRCVWRVSFRHSHADLSPPDFPARLPRQPTPSGIPAASRLLAH
jgi:hypothetical protein